MYSVGGRAKVSELATPALQRTHETALREFSEWGTRAKCQRGTDYRYLPQAIRSWLEFGGVIYGKSVLRPAHEFCQIPPAVDRLSRSIGRPA
jgi:hypothetical protein